MNLKNTTLEGIAPPGAFAAATKLTTIQLAANSPAQATFRHTGISGFWYVKLNRIASGPSTTDYSIKLGPNESHTEENPPYGDIYALADASVDKELSWYVGWEQ